MSRIASGIASLPMSWKSAAWPSTSSSARESPSWRPIASGELLHAARVARRVRVACVDGRRERLHRLGRALLQEPVRLLERDVLRLDRLGGRAQVARRPLRVREVRLLRLAHQQDGHGEDREGIQARGVVRDRDRAGRRSRRRGSAAGAARSARGTHLAPGLLVPCCRRRASGGPRRPRSRRRSRRRRRTRSRTGGRRRRRRLPQRRARRA